MVRFNPQNDNVENVYYYSDFVTLASNLNPDSTFQNTTKDADECTPVTAKRIYVQLYARHIGAGCSALAKSISTGFQIGGDAGDHFSVHNWIYTGTSDRTIQIRGYDDDDNSLSCWLRGYEIVR